jgi:UDP-N-acetylglucosamine--N-acetylmuramyl-(pentapeptide) pyrophosphoryl-undecaprenol N-acetylglucosamine transferase
MNAVTAQPVVLASGGTGGHMFPAAALAGELLARGYRLALFSDHRGIGYGAMPKAVDTYEIDSASPSGPLSRKITALWSLLRGTGQARGLLRRLDPAAVVGFGGYASVPALTAAVLSKRPIVIHEQNAVLGRANRLWAGAATAIATSFDHITGLPKKLRHGGGAVLTGNPVRAAVIEACATPYEAPEAGGKLRILVLGGSQGASVFSNVLPPALAQLPDDLRRRIDLNQQCRPEDLDRVRDAYQRIGISPVLATFFDDVPQRLAVAHLVISRSGASTVAEITAAGRPAILVPYPHAMDDHQSWNARAMEAAGAAWVAADDDFTPDFLAARLTELLASPAQLGAAAEQARGLGHGDAAIRLADLVVAVIGGTEARS